MDRIRFMDHQGQRILVFDFTGIRDPDEAARSIDYARELVSKQPLGSLLIMTLVRDARYNATTLQKMKELAVANTPYVKASALVGMSPLHRIAYQAVMVFSRRNVPAFDSEAAALAYLVQQARAPAKA